MPDYRNETFYFPVGATNGIYHSSIIVSSDEKLQSFTTKSGTYTVKANDAMPNGFRFKVGMIRNDLDDIVSLYEISGESLGEGEECSVTYVHDTTYIIQSENKYMSGKRLSFKIETEDMNGDALADGALEMTSPYQTTFTIVPYSHSTVNAGMYNGTTWDAVIPLYYDGTNWLECEWKYYDGTDWIDVDTQ